MGSRRGRSSKSDKRDRVNDSNWRSDCCMSWLVMIFKIVIIILLIIDFICDIILLMYHIQNKDEWLKENHNNEAQYYIDMACYVLAMLSIIFLIVLVATESICGIIMTLIFMVLIAAWYVYTLVRDKKPIHPWLVQVHTIFSILQAILLLCYTILLCFAT